MFEDFIITKHAIERYRERVSEDAKDIIRRIKRDLYFKKIRRIVNKGNIRHVFTFHSKEFIFVNDNGKWILKTVIKRNRTRNPQAIEKRLAAV
jgi:hypothetical protein